MTTQAPTRSATRTVLVGAAATVICSLPLYLTGALAVQLTDSLGFGLTRLGMAVGIFRATGVVTSSFMGRMADRIGATLSLRLSVITAAISAVGIGTATTSWTALAFWLVVGGAGKALCQPAANRLLINNVRAGRRGAAFGIKQSAAPAASMLGGLSVPLVALTIGWRWAYLLVAVFAVAVLFLIGRRKAPRSVNRRRKAAVVKLRDPRTIITLAASFGLGTAASSAVATFYVDAAVRAGTSQRLAGTLLATASVGALVTRVSSGLLCDRLASGHVRLCAGLLLVGSLGLALLATNVPVAMAIGAFVALAGTWGFNGVFWYSLMQAYPEAPGKVTGAVAPGGLTGSVTGPIAIGWLAEHVSYQVGWSLAGVSAVLAAAGMVYGAHRLAALSGRT